MTAIRQPSATLPPPPAVAAVAPTALYQPKAVGEGVGVKSPPPAATPESSDAVSNGGYGNRPVAGRTNGQQVETESVDLSFGDFLDIINPLQHVPIIGTIYRKLTGDEQSATANVMGGMLYGGPIGLIAAVISQQVKDSTGDEPLGHAYALLDGSPTTTPPPAASKLASANPAAAPAAAPGAAPFKTSASEPAGKSPAAPKDSAITLAQAAPPSSHRSDKKFAPPASSAQAQSSAPQPAIQAPLVSPQDMRNKMMEGLDRYQALVKARQAADAAASIIGGEQDGAVAGLAGVSSAPADGVPADKGADRVAHKSDGKGDRFGGQTPPPYGWQPAVAPAISPGMTPSITPASLPLNSPLNSYGAANGLLINQSF